MGIYVNGSYIKDVRYGNTVIKKIYYGSSLVWEKPPAINLKTGLVSVLELNETSGGTVYDSHGSNHGAVSDVLLNQTGKLGRAVTVKGTSGSYISISHSSSINFNAYTQSFTIAMWVKGSDPTPTSANARLFEKRVGTSRDGYAFMIALLYASNNNIGFYTYDKSNNPTVVINGTSVWNDNWHLLTFICDNSDMKLKTYLDGTFHSQANNTITTNATSTGSLVIGGMSTLNGGWSVYTLDQFSIWNRVLTADEIAHLYNSGSGRAYSSW